MEKTTCNICNKENSVPYLEIPNISYSDPKNFQLVKCKKCNFVYLNPRLSSTEIIKYYSTDYLPYVNKNKFMKCVQLFLFRWKRFIIELFKKDGRIIDIGSGNDNFIKYMSNYSWNADSYDKFNNSTIDDINECTENYYDVITLWHSIEHIHNVDKILKKIKRILKKDGILIIACPNINSIDSDLLGAKWIAYDSPRHLYHFSPETLGKFLSKFNLSIVTYYRMYQDTLFNIIKSKRINIFYRLFYIIYSLIIIIFSKQKSSSFLYICKLK